MKTILHTPKWSLTVVTFPGFREVILTIAPTETPIVPQNNNMITIAGKQYMVTGTHTNYDVFEIVVVVKPI